MAGPFSTIDTVCSRRQAFEYLSPPFCEADFSSSGEPVIVLSPFRRRRGPTGFAATVVNGRIRFRWNTTDGAVCYSLYRLENGQYVLEAECVPCETCEDSTTDCCYTCETCGPGTYVVTMITLDGESDPSDEIEVAGFAAECNDIPGQPVPTGLDAFDIPTDGGGDPIPIEWPEFTVDSTTWVVWPTNSDRMTQELGEYPPGHYDIKLVTGFFDEGPSGPNVCGAVNLNAVIDDNFNYTTTPVGEQITRNIYLVDPPNTETIAQGISFCGLTYASVEAQHQSFWNSGGTPRRFKNQNKHENDGGLLLAGWDLNTLATFTTVPFFDYKLQLVQIDGLIAQPRNVRVQGWSFIKMFFSPALQAWDGVFTERTTYESADLVYTAPGFALAYYAPTGQPSVNGAGWIVELGGGGGEWVGTKPIDDTAEGQYRRTAGSPNVPACVVLEEVPEEP